MPEFAPAAAAQPLVPPLFLAAVIACVAGAAALADCALLAALLRHSRTGLCSIIIQLAVADIILLSTTIGPELWYLNAKTWHFGSGGCVAFQGLNVFTFTLTTYLVIAIALHSLTTIRLEEKSIERKFKRKVRDDEIGSSQHSLVANSDSSTPPRTMNVDYRAAATMLPVTLPTVFVWILAISLSTPEFILATIDNQRKHITICMLHFSHQCNIQMMLAVFSLFLPLFLMTTTGALIVVKLVSKSRPKLLEPETDSDSVAALKLSLWLMCVHFVLCTPRAAIKAYSAFTTSCGSATDNNFVTDDTIAVINFVLCSVYFIALLLRPLVCIMSLSQLKIFFSFRGKTDEIVNRQCSLK